MRLSLRRRVLQRKYRRKNVDTADDWLQQDNKVSAHRRNYVLHINKIISTRVQLNCFECKSSNFSTSAPFRTSLFRFFLLHQNFHFINFTGKLDGNILRFYASIGELSPCLITGNHCVRIIEDWGVGDVNGSPGGPEQLVQCPLSLCRRKKRVVIVRRNGVLQISSVFWHPILLRADHVSGWESHDLF